MSEKLTQTIAEKLMPRPRPYVVYDAGVPGFNPIQDYVNYDVRTHHTNMDTVDRLDIKDITQAAVVMAWYAYNTAMADGRIPRPAAK